MKLDVFLTNVANALRELLGTTDSIRGLDIPQVISDIPKQNPAPTVMTTQDQTTQLPQGYYPNGATIQTNITNLFPQYILKGINVGGVVGELEPLTVEGQLIYPVSITATGSYTSSSYQQGYWASQSGSTLFITVKGGTSSGYENIYFLLDSAPSGVALADQSYYSYASTSTDNLYTARLTGVNTKTAITLNFDSTDSSSDYVRCRITVSEVD